MATTQHYVWAAGHFILLISAFRYLTASFLFRGPSPWWYKASFAGAIASYAIVCNKSLGTPQPNAAWLKRAYNDENIQYLVVALFWWTSKPVAVALVPYAIFSLFHALTFTRTTLMPQFLPSGPPATADGPPTPHPLAKKLQVWVKSNYDSAMRLVAYTELFIFARVIGGALTFQNSLLTPLFYAHFLRLRYFQSAFTRDALAIVNKNVEGYVNKPGAPPVLGKVWTQFKAILNRWAGSTLVQAPPAARR